MIATQDAISATDALFFHGDSAPDRAAVERLARQSLAGLDDGELFLEYRESEAIVLDDQRIRSASFDTMLGFGLRGIAGEATGYAHAGEVSEAALHRAAGTVAAVRSGASGSLAVAPRATNTRLYSPDNPLTGMEFAAKTQLLSAIDAYARGRDSRVRQVSATLSGEWQAVRIIRADGAAIADLRPLVRLNVSIVVEKGSRRESGSFGSGGRFAYATITSEAAWKAAVDEALRQALVNLEAVPAPAGEMDVVLGPGWPGILLHEAIGHGLEGDFNRKGTSAFAGLLGQRIASPGVTVVDDGTIADRRGSLSVDDEGTPSGRTVMIEDGILRAYIHDRLSARLMGTAPTGNGRRQSYAHVPMPRMTNTIMLNGPDSPESLLDGVKSGLYAKSFGGGQVDITSGKFVFNASEAYLIENGRIGAPVKGAMLIGDGATALTRITGVANDLEMDPGIGTCGKNGQGVPVGVGQPSMRIGGLTVGGTAVKG
jgi:TldD protein